MPVSPTSREQLRDLAALLALPRMWRGLDPAAIASSLLDVLVSLLRLDAAWVQIAGNDESEGTFEDRRPPTGPPTAELGEALRSGPAAGPGIHTTANPVGPGTLRVLRITPHLESERVVVLAGSLRTDFPTEFESFLCKVAVEQAMLALHTSRLVKGLRSANAAKATFLATMSHELRKPLNAIIGYAGLLQGEITGPLQPQQKQHVTRIEGAARHLIDIIEGILSFARIEAGRERVNLQDLRIGDVVANIVGLIEPLARTKGLEVKVQLADPDQRMYSDSAKIRQILLNLLSNAVKFTASGHVGLEVRSEGPDVRWIVTDTGVGVEPGNRERIFEPFRQLGDSHASRSPGTGLGLSVSRHLARLLGGDVTVESTTGPGSTFVARLPVRSREVTPAPAKS